MPVKTDKATLDLIAKVKQQKEEIAKTEKPNYKTNQSFSMSNGKQNDAINLHVESNLGVLINIAAFLMDRQDSYAQAVTLLGVDNPPEFIWGGSPVSDWIDDLKIRVTKVQIASKKKKLEALEDRLNKIISPDLRAQLELEAIAKELA